ncbi:hypothetical protein AM587_10000761 [Phytophthora nicotianae]|uniref:Uncharacterized protein n=1 Tax=Phytophthora nicotianae TaxID=4792 RepID=A0A0W8CMN1_PHYNI|nr:hypothetical protein AM587_10000761 [Phytophthora nicotianae]
MFIDSKWRLIKLSLLAPPNTQEHSANTVADSIKSEISTRYDIDIDQYARFTVSDTTESARNVSDHFSSTDQVDCLMHLLSLCLLYGLGLKKNTTSDGRVVVTLGGEFRDGLCVIQKLRDLASFFNSPSRLTELKQIKDVFGLPPVDIEVDSKTRVGYAVTLMRRSVFNHYAFTKYFESAPLNEQTLWSSISSADWELITEMEGLTDQLAQFSVGNVQKDERPTFRGNEFTQRRQSKLVSEFTWGGIRCRDRLREQLALRFPIQDVNDIKALLLDPRIKANASIIVSDSSALSQAENELQLELEFIFQKYFARNVVNDESKETVLEEAQTEQHCETTPDSAMCSLLEKLCLMKANWRDYQRLQNDV